MSPAMASYVKTIAGVAATGESDYATDGRMSSTNLPRGASQQNHWDQPECRDETPELWLYRDRSMALLKRYVRLSVEIGRLPSLLGREFFRGHVTSYTVTTFEDTVIFVYDVEQSLEKLDKFDQALIAKIVLEEYSQREAARLLNCPLRTVERCFPEALDHLSEILLAGGILTPMA